MTIRPLAALKCKLGELKAVGRLPAGGDPQPRVLLELTAGVRVDIGARVFPALLDATTRLAEAGQPLWVDAGLLGGSAPLARQPGGALRFLDGEVEDRRGLLGVDSTNLVPVVSAEAPVARLREVALLLEHRPRDVVVRIAGPGTTPELAAHLDAVVRHTRVGHGALHAVVDLGFVDVVDRARADRLTEVAAYLVDRLGPGSTTLLAGSIPASRSGYTPVTRDRPETELWRVVNDRVEVGYGDYGVTHPVASAAEESEFRRSPSPYLHYTVPGRTLTLRRRLSTSDGPVTASAAGLAFTELAGELVARAEYAGPDYSWGDHQLSRCRRSGGTGFGSVSRWVEIATSHHLAHLARRSRDQADW